MLENGPLFLEMLIREESTPSADFDAWYGGVYAAGISGGFGGGRCTRYQRVPIGRTGPRRTGDYLTLCELGSFDAASAGRALQDRIASADTAMLDSAKYVERAIYEPVPGGRVITREGVATRALLMVATNCADPNRENEFDEWYNKIHLPDIVAGKQYVGGTRFRRMKADADQAQHIAFYEMDTDDVSRAEELQSEAVADMMKRGRLIDFVATVYRGYYVPINPS